MDAIVIRRFRLEGQLREVGESVTLPRDQFDGFRRAGMVDKPPRERKTTAQKPARRAKKKQASA